MSNRKNKKTLSAYELVRLRDAIIAMLSAANTSTRLERRVSLGAAVEVANRALRRSRGGVSQVRVFSALRAVGAFVSLAAVNKVTVAALNNSDLLSVGHPLSTKRHSMTEASLRHAQAVWISADKLIRSDEARALVATAYSFEHGSIERTHAFARLAAFPLGVVPITVSVDLEPLIAALGLGLGGNSNAARSLRARMQRRDRIGRFAFMGGGWLFGMLRGGNHYRIAGRVVGMSGTNDVEVEVAGDSSLPDGIYAVEASKGLSVKAIVRRKRGAPPAEEVAVPSEDWQFSINTEDLVRRAAPSDWRIIKEIPRKDDSVLDRVIYANSDGYTVVTSRSAEFTEADDISLLPAHGAWIVRAFGPQDTSVNKSALFTWADVEKAILKDQDNYQKYLDSPAGQEALRIGAPGFDAQEEDIAESDADDMAPEKTVVVNWATDEADLTDGDFADWAEQNAPGVKLALQPNGTVRLTGTESNLRNAVDQATDGDRNVSDAVMEASSFVTSKLSPAELEGLKNATKDIKGTVQSGSGETLYEMIDGSGGGSGGPAWFRGDDVYDAKKDGYRETGKTRKETTQKTVNSYKKISGAVRDLHGADTMRGLTQEFRAADEKGDVVRFSYGGKTRRVLPKDTYVNPKTGKSNVVGFDLDVGEERTYSFDKISSPPALKARPAAKPVAKIAPPRTTGEPIAITSTDPTEIKDLIQEAIDVGAVVTFSYGGKNRLFRPERMYLNPKTNATNVTGFSETDGEGRTFTLNKMSPPVYAPDGPAQPPAQAPTLTTTPQIFDPFSLTNWRDIDTGVEMSSAVSVPIPVVDSNGNTVMSRVVDVSKRPMTIVNINGVDVPFYVSTGSGGKKNVPADKWYPFFGLDPESNWFNKTSEEDIADYYGSSELRNVAAWLDTNLPNARANTEIPKSIPDGENKHIAQVTLDAVNNHMKPAARGMGNNDLQSNVNNTLAAIKNGRSPTGFLQFESRFDIDKLPDGWTSVPLEQKDGKVLKSQLIPPSWLVAPGSTRPPTHTITLEDGDTPVLIRMGWAITPDTKNKQLGKFGTWKELTTAITKDKFVVAKLKQNVINERTGGPVYKEPGASGTPMYYEKPKLGPPSEWAGPYVPAITQQDIPSPIEPAKPGAPETKEQADARARESMRLTERLIAEEAARKKRLRELQDKKTLTREEEAELGNLRRRYPGLSDLRDTPSPIDAKEVIEQLKSEIPAGNPELVSYTEKALARIRKDIERKEREAAKEKAYQDALIKKIRDDSEKRIAWLKNKKTRTPREERELYESTYGPAPLVSPGEPAPVGKGPHAPGSTGLNGEPAKISDVDVIVNVDETLDGILSDFMKKFPNVRVMVLNEKTPDGDAVVTFAVPLDDVANFELWQADNISNAKPKFYDDGGTAPTDRLNDDDIEMPFDKEMFDGIFSVPEGAYRPDIFQAYSPKGRTNQDSADYTDDPEVLSAKFEPLELAKALSEAVLPKDGVPATGYGELEFQGGNEPVAAEALLEALAISGVNDTAILSGIYDRGLTEDGGVPTNVENAQKNIWRSGAIDDELTVGERIEAAKKAQALNGLLGQPENARTAFNLISNHTETNPHIIELATDLQMRVDMEMDAIYYGYGDEGLLERLTNDFISHLPWSRSDDPQELDGFRAFWGLFMTIDGGDGDLADFETGTPGSRMSIIDAIRSFVDVENPGIGEDAAHEMAVEQYYALHKKFGGFPEFITGKSDISNGTDSLYSETTAAAFYRLIAAAKRPTDTDLARVIGIDKDSESFKNYTTPGFIFAIDPRAHSVVASDSDGTASDTLITVGRKLSRVVFKIKAGDADGISVSGFSHYFENEVMTVGEFIVDAVREQDGFFGKEYVVQLKKYVKEQPNIPEESAAPAAPNAPASAFAGIRQYGDVSDWTRSEEGPSGSNAGGVHTDDDGNEYYVKTAKSQSHGEMEALGSAFYKELGITAGETGLGEQYGELAIITPMIPGSTTGMYDLRDDKEFVAKIQEGFAIDAWLSNYDVIGMEYDNIIVDTNGNPVRIDQGGSLIWRARGSHKEWFGPEVAELTSMRDPRINATAGRVYKSMSPAQLTDSARKLLDIKPSRIDEIIDGAISDPEQSASLKDVLKRRREYILDFYGIKETTEDPFANRVPLTESIGYAAQDLQANDVTAADSFVIERVFRDETTPKGKVSIQGYFPGHESQRKEWNDATVIPVARGGTIPPKGDRPALHRPQKPRATGSPAFTGVAADAVANAKTWQEAADAIRALDIVFLDYETTGLPGPEAGGLNRPVQIGAVRVKDGKVVDSISIYMNPEHELSGWSAAALKQQDGTSPVTNEWLAGQLSMKDAHQQFLDFVGEGPVIIGGQNVPFDIEILQRVLKEQGLSIEISGTVDSKDISAGTLPKWTQGKPDGPSLTNKETGKTRASNSLGPIAEYLGVKLPDWHRADADAQASWEITDAMLTRAVSNPDTPTTLLNNKEEVERQRVGAEKFTKEMQEYEVALADYVAAKAIAAAWNCGGAGITAAVGPGDGPCSTPDIPSLIRDATPEPLGDPDPDDFPSGLVESQTTDNAVHDGIDTNDPYKDEAFMPTEEQRNILDAILAGKNVVVQALAGTGKTATLLIAGKRKKKEKKSEKGVYIAFNKSAQVEAEKKFRDAGLTNIEVITNDAISYRWSSKEMQAKFSRTENVVQYKKIADLFGITEFEATDGEMLKLRAAVKEFRDAVNAFMISDDAELSAKHFGDGDGAGKPWMVDIAQKMWEDYINPDGKMRVTNTVLTKMWGLSKPDLGKTGSGLSRGVDFIFFDEAQDINPVSGKVIADQTVQKVYVGDENQAIYGFRGGENQLGKVLESEEFPLTKSWRFGSVIANEGNKWLRLLESDPRVADSKGLRVIGGNVNPGSIVEQGSLADTANAVLVRTNSGGLGAIYDQLGRGRVVGVTKNYKGDLENLRDTAQFLMTGADRPKILHDELAPFASWADVVKAVEQGDETKKLKLFVDLVEEIKIDGVSELIGRLKIVRATGESDAKASNIGDLSLGSTGVLGNGVEYAVDENGPYLTGKTFENKTAIGKSGWDYNKVNDDKKWRVPVKDQDDPAAVRAAVEKLSKALGGSTSEDSGKIDVLVTTVHQAKGLEWDKVWIWGDFFGPRVNKETGEVTMPDPTEYKIAYVAVTRSKDQIDVGSLDWINEYISENEATPESPEAAPRDATSVNADDALVKSLKNAVKEADVQLEKFADLSSKNEKKVKKVRELVEKSLYAYDGGQYVDTEEWLTAASELLEGANLPELQSLFLEAASAADRVRLSKLEVPAQTETQTPPVPTLDPEWRPSDVPAPQGAVPSGTQEAPDDVLPEAIETAENSGDNNALDKTKRFYDTASREKDIELMFNDLEETADIVINGEDSGLKGSDKSVVKKAFEKVKEIRKALADGAMPEHEALAALNAIIDSLPSSGSSSVAQIDMDFFRDAVTAITHVLDGQYYWRPTGKGLPPIDALDPKGRAVGYARDGVTFLVPGTRVRDKWGYAGTVESYNENDWVNVNVRYDIDPRDPAKVKKGKWGAGVARISKHPATLSVIGPDEDPYVELPSTPEGKRPTDLDKQLAWLKKHRGGDPSPKVDAPSGASDKDAKSALGFDVLNFEVVGGQLGANAGGTYKDSDGNLYYVKEQQSLTHAENEILAFELYKELGVNVAQMQIGSGTLNGNIYTVSKFISGDGSTLKKYREDEQVLDKVRSDFAIDAWLANGDAVGHKYANIVVDQDGTPFRIDAGGALLFIGPGHPKGTEFGGTVAELDDMLNIELSEGSAAVFSPMTRAAKAASARKLLGITQERVDEIVDANMSDPETASKIKARLKARREYIFKHYGIQDIDSPQDNYSANAITWGEHLLEPGANLEGADLSDADLSKVDLAGASLIGANLTGAILTEANLTGADLSKANLSFADLTGANLSYADAIGAKLAGANLAGADLSHANIEKADLSEANMIGANLTRTRMFGADMSGVNLSKTELIDVSFSYADLSAANLSEANLRGAKFNSTKLLGTNLSGADLSGAMMLHAKLAGANLTGANMTGASLGGANLAGADLTGATLISIDAQYIKFAGATMPDGKIFDKDTHKFPFPTADEVPEAEAPKAVSEEDAKWLAVKPVADPFKFLDKVEKQYKKKNSKFGREDLNKDNDAIYFAYYGQGGAHDVNTALLDIENADKNTLDNIEKVDRMLTRAPGLEQDILVYRGVGGDSSADATKNLIDVEPGDEFVSVTYSSTSIIKSIAEGFAGGDGGGILLEIVVPKGIRGAFIDAWYGRSMELEAPYSQSFIDDEGAEAELMLPRNMKYRVLSKDGNTIKLVALGPETDKQVAKDYDEKIPLADVSVPDVLETPEAPEAAAPEMPEEFISEMPKPSEQLAAAAEKYGVDISSYFDESFDDDDVEQSTNDFSLGKDKSGKIVAADAVIIKDERYVMMIGRAFGPFRGSYALPGGFLDKGESFADAAAREMQEEVGVPDPIATNVYNIGVVDSFDWDPRALKGAKVGAVVFHVPSDTKHIAGDDAATAQFVDIEDIISGEKAVAFGHATWLKRAFISTEYEAKLDVIVLASKERNARLIAKINDVRTARGYDTIPPAGPNVWTPENESELTDVSTKLQHIYEDFGGDTPYADMNPMVAEFLSIVDTQTNIPPGLRASLSSAVADHMGPLDSVSQDVIDELAGLIKQFSASRSVYSRGFVQEIDGIDRTSWPASLKDEQGISDPKEFFELTGLATILLANSLSEDAGIISGLIVAAADHSMMKAEIDSKSLTANVISSIVTNYVLQGDFDNYTGHRFNATVRNFADNFPQHEEYFAELSEIHESFRHSPGDARNAEQRFKGGRRQVATNQIIYGVNAPALSLSGVPERTDVDGKPISVSEFSGVPSLMGAVSTVLARPASPHGMALSAAVDGDSIDDLDVRVTTIINPDGDTKLRLRFRLTPWAGQKRAMEIEKEGGWTISKPMFRASSRDKDGNIVEDSKYTGPEYAEAFPSGRLYMSFGDDNSEGFDISITRASNRPVDTAPLTTQSAGAPAAFHNEVVIDIDPDNATEEIIIAALKKAGVVDPRAAQPEDAKTLIENKLLSLFYGQVVTEDNLAGEGRAIGLAKIEERYGVTADVTFGMVIVTVGDNGRLQYLFPEYVANSIAEKTGTESFTHSLSIGKAMQAARAKNGSKKLTEKETINVAGDVIAGMIISGLQSTAVRLSEGRGEYKGLSSDEDIYTGGGNYVFLTPRSVPVEHFGKGSKDYIIEASVVFPPANVYNRADLYANIGDSFGKRIRYTEVISASGPNNHETMVKNGLDIANKGNVVFVAGPVYDSALAKLDALGISEINGIPVRELIKVQGTDDYTLKRSVPTPEQTEAIDSALTKLVGNADGVDFKEFRDTFLEIQEVDGAPFAYDWAPAGSKIIAATFKTDSGANRGNLNIVPYIKARAAYSNGAPILIVRWPDGQLVEHRPADLATHQHGQTTSFVIDQFQLNQLIGHLTASEPANFILGGKAIAGEDSTNDYGDVKTVIVPVGQGLLGLPREHDVLYTDESATDLKKYVLDLLEQYDTLFPDNLQMETSTARGMILRLTTLLLGNITPEERSFIIQEVVNRTANTGSINDHDGPMRTSQSNNAFSAVSYDQPIASITASGGSETGSTTLIEYVIPDEGAVIEIVDGEDAGYTRTIYRAKVERVIADKGNQRLYEVSIEGNREGGNVFVLNNENSYDIDKENNEIRFSYRGVRYSIRAKLPSDKPL